tara:strand:+ start:2357 stop:2821 length:465 start_codon:yes stop_codon:yes gene_type:complete
MNADEKKYEMTIEGMVALGRYETLKELGEALKLSPQTINSHKKSGRIPGKIAIRFTRTHDCRIDPNGNYFILEESVGSKQSSENEIEIPGRGFANNTNDPMVKGLINMLDEIKNTDTEMFDGLLGRIIRKYNDLKESKDTKRSKFEPFKNKNPN